MSNSGRRGKLPWVVSWGTSFTLLLSVQEFLSFLHVVCSTTFSKKTKKPTSPEKLGWRRQSGKQVARRNFDSESAYRLQRNDDHARTVSSHWCGGYRDNLHLRDVSQGRRSAVGRRFPSRPLRRHPGRRGNSFLYRCHYFSQIAVTTIFFITDFIPEN